GVLPLSHQVQHRRGLWEGGGEEHVAVEPRPAVCDHPDFQASLLKLPCAVSDGTPTHTHTQASLTHTGIPHTHRHLTHTHRHTTHTGITHTHKHLSHTQTTLIHTIILHTVQR